MASPLFLLQIVRVNDGAIAVIPAGGPLEADLINICTSHILSKGIAFKTTKHVERDIKAGIADAIMSLKMQTKHIV